MRHVLVITLGPVQDFIHAARRCRDLWFGSWLLSELSKATAHGVSGSAELVFPGAPPAELAPATDTSVANKIVAVVADGIEPGEVVRRGRAALDRRLGEIRTEAFIRVNDPGHFFCRTVAEQQVADLIEIQWAAAPMAGDGYAGARRAAEALLAARKHTRLWAPVSWGADVPKSSIDGERESVLDERLYDDFKTEPEKLRQRYGVGASERLCGVGLLKRHGKRRGMHAERFSHHFLSTGHLAAWPLLERMDKLPSTEQEALRQLWETLLGVLARHGAILKDSEIYADNGPKHAVLGRYDAGLLFENRLHDLFEDEPDRERKSKAVQAARGPLAAFLKRLGVSTPLPYFAILVADGDHMGRAIERQTEVEGHQALSRALDRFARTVPQIVEKEHGGELIYAGGDDVLAFVPLHKVLPCAQALATNFRRSLQNFGDEAGSSPTLSVGIGISHFLEPMGASLRLAQRAEKLAKRTRNALAVIVDKRSGATIEASGPWGPLDEQLLELTEMHLADEVPDGAAYELEKLSGLLQGVQDAERDSLAELVCRESERILRRKQPKQGTQSKLADSTLKQLLEILDPAQSGKAGGLQNLTDLLLIARVIADAAREANPEQENEKGGRS